MTAHQNVLLILSKNAARYASLLRAAHLKDLEWHAADGVDKARRTAGRASIILGDPPLVAAILKDARRLRWVQSTFAGVDALLPLAPDRFVLTHVKGVFGPLMSEYVFGYILALERNLFTMRENQMRRHWREMPYRSLRGRRIGICGTGDIGRHLAKTARHFGMEVWGYRRSPRPCPDVDRVFFENSFREFLAGPDVVVITLPLTPATRYLFDENAFAAMKDTAVLINVGRGHVVCERDLIRAIQQRQIQGAILDVFETEPLPEESPLWTLPEVFITPHHSAFSFAEDIIAIFLENYRRFNRKKPLKYVVDPSRQY